MFAVLATAAFTTLDMGAAPQLDFSSRRIDLGSSLPVTGEVYHSGDGETTIIATVKTDTAAALTVRLKMRTSLLLTTPVVRLYRNS